MTVTFHLFEVGRFHTSVLGDLRSSRSWLRVTSEPGRTTQGREASAGSIPDFPAACLPPSRPEPQHPRPARAGGGHRGGEALVADPGARPAPCALGPAAGLSAPAAWGWGVNHKRVQRVWREEGLQRPLPRRCKRSRPSGGRQGSAEGRVPAPRVGDRLAVRPDDGWPVAQIPDRDGRIQPRLPGH